jgi:type VI secretion system protein ImpE
MSLEAAERAVRDSDLQTALHLLQDQIRQQPARSDLRVFLFQLLSVLGQWERALTQLNVAADLDAKTLAMAQMYREAIKCEALRADVFAGKTSPVVFGQPEEWLALLIESMLVHGQSRPSDAQTLRARAFESAPATTGSLDGQAFEWIADADMRLGPICEAVINGRYYWVPFERLARIDIEAPVDLRDVVWMPAHFQFANGGDAVGVIPTRYPGSENADEAALSLARKTVWREDAPEVFSGVGQRIFATDSGEHPIMDVRTIVLGAAVAEAPVSGHA